MDCASRNSTADFVLRRRDGEAQMVVDVLGDDGLFWHGRVEACAKEGLRIRFGTGHDPGAQLIPFGKIYHGRTLSLRGYEKNSGMRYTRSIENDEELAVEALMRFGQCDLWKWYPATLLMGDSYMHFFGFISASVKGRVVKTILRGSRIQLPHPRKLIKDGDFYAAPERRPITTGKITNEENHSVPYCVSSSRDSLETGISSLLSVILTEIFSYLPTVQQNRIRTVCLVWNYALSLPLVIYHFYLDYGYARADQVAEEEYLNAASICHRWSPIITITNYPRWVPFKVVLPTSSARFLQIMMQENKNPPADKMFLHNQHWNINRDRFLRSISSNAVGEFIGYLHTELDAFASVCRTLLIRNLTVSLLSSNMVLQFRVRITNGRIGDGVRRTLNDWWEMIDNSFPAPTDDDFQMLTDWIDEAVQTWDKDIYTRIMMVVDTVQVSDPRSNLNYRREGFPMWCEINYDYLAKLDVRRLTRFTVHALLSELQNERCTLSSILSW
ncbi:uncharacterized protein LOC129595151 [Paramacrobiotus metropolitanus]|uniref:uncharacterized protein LOC129595151 n=1 Tax=Paramacrobiotus metropolitanus TaxID=2943436 RepID=UPI002446295E|nr:uncharacterized protein LOC129595151 [Paramacrobiotus metropolitanus]